MSINISRPEDLVLDRVLDTIGTSLSEVVPVNSTIDTADIAQAALKAFGWAMEMCTDDIVNKRGSSDENVDVPRPTKPLT